MVFISVTVTGLDELLARLGRIESEAANVRHAVLDRSADLLANEMRNNAHVVTGRMRGSISRGTASDRDVQVVATAPYSWFENKRVGTVTGSKYNTGPHDFADRAFQTTMDQFPTIVQTEYDRLFSS